MTTYDFGAGPVPAHQHPNGGGWVSDSAIVYGSAQVAGNAIVYGSAQVYGNAIVYGSAQVYGNAWVYGDARVYGNAWVYGDARVAGSARVAGDAIVEGSAQVYGNARVYGNAIVYGSARVYGSAQVAGIRDYLVLGPLGSRDSWLTVTFRPTPIIEAGCWRGSPAEFAKRVKEVHGDSSYGLEYARAIQYIEAEVAARKKVKP